MRLVAVLVGLAGVLLLGGCSLFQTAREVPEDREVAAKCTSVKALLSKNVRADASAAVPWLFKSGGLYERTGAILDPTDAARALRVDQACRSWVKGALSATEYGRVVLENTSAAIVQTTSTEERQSVVEAVADYFDDLKAKGLLPIQFATNAVVGQVNSDAKLAKEELDAKLNASMAAMDVKIGAVNQVAEIREAQLLSRLDEIERRLTELGTFLPPVRRPPVSEFPSNGTTSDAGAQVITSGSKSESTASNTKSEDTVNAPTSMILGELEIHFSTGSSEIQFADRRRLEAAAVGWKSSNSTIYLMGFADPRGSPEYNAKLSRERAAVVADLLTRLNVTVGAISSGGVELGSAHDSIRRVQLRAVRAIKEQSF